MEPTIQYRKMIYLPEDVHGQWERYKQANPEQSFNGLVIRLLTEALCVTAAPTSTTRSGM